MSMPSTLTLRTWVTLLQETNRKREEWEERCHYWKHKYQTLYQEHMHTLLSLCCDACRSPDDEELCNTCATKWKKCT